MERWYLPILCHGRAHIKVEQLSRYVQQNQLFDLIPVAFVERKPKGQFYLVMAINSETKSQVPDKLQGFLHQLGHPLPAAVAREDIERMVSGPINPYDYARHIEYKEVQEPPQDYPLDLSVISSIHHVLDSQDMSIRSNQYNKLLYWLSAVGHGTWHLFKSTCMVLGLDSSGIESRRILRRLRLLGHIETSPDGSKWSICPPSLVAIKNAQTQEYILAGQRNAQLVEVVTRLGTDQRNFIEQPDGCAPPAVHLPYPLDDVVELVKKEMGNRCLLTPAGMVAQKLAELLPPLDGWLDSLPAIGKFVLSLYTLERFVDSIFAPCIFEGRSGMYRLLQRDHNTQSYQTLYYDQDSNKWVQGDWYGLRFLALRQAGIKCRAVYYSALQRLALPIGQRWPEVYERALVLSSGRLSKRENEWLFFDNITRNVAQDLSTKLAVTYEEVQ